jgi:flap endonuclease-1
MGIKNLNTFLEKHAKMAINEHNLSRYKNKRIAIDTSIFLYKFKYSGKFYESFINQVSHFRRFDINPIYIFDGAPPKEKQDVLAGRKEQKNKIQQKILDLEEQVKILSNVVILSDDELIKKKELEILITLTRKKCINITKEDVDNLKKVFDIMGVKYIQAECEADFICCNLFKLDMVDMCLSNDMDFLPSGCGILLRNYNNSNNILEYNLQYILQLLKFSYEQFVDFCILCGCDYTCKIPKLGCETAYKYIKEHSTIEKVIELYCGEDKKFKLPPNFEYQKSRDLIMKNQNLDNLVIENDSFKKPEVIHMEKEITFIQTLTNFTRKQLENRLNKIIV